MTKVYAPVTLRALVQRINRSLAKDDELLRKSRGLRMALAVGDWYIVNIRRNWIVGKNVDPEALGRDLEVLHPWEKVIDDDEGGAD
jgi:hypothetical protein